MPAVAVGTNNTKGSTKGFVNFLAQEGLIKAGFAQVIGSYSLEEAVKYLRSKNLISSEKLNISIAKYFGIEYGSLVNVPINPAVVGLIPLETVKELKVLPYQLHGLELSLAIGKPSLLQYNIPEILDKIRKAKGFSFKLVVVPPADIDAVIKKLNTQSEQKPVVDEAEQKPPAAPQPPPVTKQVELGEKTIDLTSQEIDPSVLARLPVAVARKYQLVVFDSVEPKTQFDVPVVKIAAANPHELHVREIVAYIQQKNKVTVDLYKTTKESLQSAIEKYPKTTAEPVAAKEAPVAEKKLDSDEEVTNLPEDLTSQTTLPGEKAQATEIEPRPDIERGNTENKKADVAAPEGQQSDAAKSEESKPIVSDGEAVVVQQGDIVARPTEESAADLQRLAKEQQSSIQDQNLDRLLRKPVTSASDLAQIIKQAIIPEIVAGTLFLAIRMEASDVHIEAEQNSVRFRFRIDGILHDVVKVPKFLHAPLISRIKILAKMKIDEQRVPQDGRFDVVIDKRQVDLRISTLPTVHGEKVVMRLLDKSGGVISLEQLGLTGSGFDRVIESINKPYGIVLSTGPTGSGKSTTLYAVLSRISKPGVNIITLEDPVEYELPGINQSQVKPSIGFTFADGLRSVLRQDPNVIMVGEVRDLETAAMATHAALTGHLVLTTLHTNDAAGALPRLINMGVEPFLITSSINAVIGQRLVRKICDNCREPVDVPPGVKQYAQQLLADVPSGQLKNIDLNQLVFYHGRGCEKCTNGYKGRIGIFEVLVMSDPIEEMAVRKAPASEIKSQAVKEGMVRMTQDGLIKALKGITTIDEVMRVTTTEIKEVPGVEQ